MKITFKENKELNDQLLIAGVMVMMFAVVLFGPEIAEASDSVKMSAALKGPYESIKALFNGWGAKIITLCSFAFAAIGGILRFNMALIGGAIGTGIFTASAPTIVDLIAG